MRGDFVVKGSTVAMDSPLPNIFVFCTFIAAAVAARRGGKSSSYISECASFMEDVVGKRLSVLDPLPPDYEWTPNAAKECAEAMMEYDHD